MTGRAVLGEGGLVPGLQARRDQNLKRQTDSGWEALERATPGLDVSMPSEAPSIG